ncbi:MAG TPA: hypothetical protein VGC60_02195 [Pyrinomonadaceae bacterium]
MISIHFFVSPAVLFFAPARDMSPQAVLLRLWPVAVGIIIALLVVLYRRKKARERTQIMKAAAAQLGWTFSAEAPWNYIPGLDRFTLFDQGHGKQVKNMLYGEASGVKAAVFDYIYTTGSGKNSSTHYQTVVYLEPANLLLTHFSLRPEGLMSKVLSAFGYQDIDFGQRPEFSRQYILRGQDEPAIRQTFNDGVLSFYESYPGTCTDAGGNQLFLFRGGYQFQPQEIQSYVGLALKISNLLRPY